MILSVPSPSEVSSVLSLALVSSVLPKFSMPAGVPLIILSAPYESQGFKLENLLHLDGTSTSLARTRARLAAIDYHGRILALGEHNYSYFLIDCDETINSTKMLLGMVFKIRLGLGSDSACKHGREVSDLRNTTS
jgi:hypothetical protein